MSVGIAERSPRIRDGLREVTLVYLGVRLLLFVLSAFGDGLVALPPGQPTSVPGWPAHIPSYSWTALFTATERQDALWFLRIATGGYRPFDGSAAFFPLYPLAVRILDAVPGIGTLAAALLAANAACFGALLLLHALTRLELGGEAARRTIVFQALFPTAFFLMAPYTEPLFLLLSVATFWCARRGRWGWAAAMGAGAAATRSIGLLLIPALAVEALAQWRRREGPLLPRLLASVAIGVGPALYFAYWGWRDGNLWAPLDAQATWSRHPTSPLRSLGHAVTLAWQYRGWWLVDLTLVTLAVAGVIVAARKVPLAYTVYAGASILLPLSFPYWDRPLLSMPRFVVVLFPAMWGFAIAAAKKRPPEVAIVVAFAAGYGLLAVSFMNWGYIF
ncbi:MAG: mannosyltransferase family protein [Planctomycetaceae bacterium]